MLNPKIIRNKYEEITSPPKFKSSAMYPIIIRLIPETIIEAILTVNPLTRLLRFFWTNKIMVITIKLILKNRMFPTLT